MRDYGGRRRFCVSDLVIRGTTFKVTTAREAACGSNLQISGAGVSLTLLPMLLHLLLLALELQANLYCGCRGFTSINTNRKLIFIVNEAVIRKI